MPDAEQRHDVAVPARLHEQALACVDEHDRQIGGRCPGDHVARVVLVSGCVRNDESSPDGRKIAVRDVDRDALLALGRETVEYQRVVDVAAARAELPGIGVQRRQLVVAKRMALVKQAAEQRAVAIVHAAAGDEPQRPPIIARIRHWIDFHRDRVRWRQRQKYPSCFFFSIEPLESWSMTRP